MALLFKKQQSLIGLDIGSSMIKAVKMTKKGDDYLLESYAMEPIEEGALQSGEIKNPSSLAQSAMRAVEKCDPVLKDVVISLANYSILSDVLTMDLIPEKEIREAVLVEAQRMSPFDMSEIEIDYAVLHRDDEAKKMKVLMVAAKNDLILSFADCMNEAGLRAVVLDVDLFALLNIFYLNYDAENYRSCILINIGSETTDAAFLQNGVFHSAREIPIAGSNYINQINMATGFPPLKIHNILNGKVEQDVDINKVVNAVNSVSVDFANAVGVAISYFQASEVVDKMDLIVLAGGYALIPGLINILELRTGSEVIILDPFAKIQCDDSVISLHERERFGKVLSVAMGLATRTY